MSSIDSSHKNGNIHGFHERVKEKRYQANLHKQKDRFVFKGVA